MTRLLLIRHGAYTSAGTPSVDQGLSPAGIRQAERLRDRLAAGLDPVDVLIASTLPRARETASIIAPALNLSVQLASDLEEWRNSGPDAMPPDQLIAEFLALPPTQRAFLEPGPGLETWGAFATRICTALHRIMQAHQDRHIAIVAHGGVIEATFAYCYGVSPYAAYPFMMMLDPAHTSLTRWRYVPQMGQWRLETYSEAAHLGEP